MNPHAFQILDGLGLPTPRVFSLTEAINEPPDRTFYLRYSRDSNRPNQVLPISQVKERHAELFDLIKQGALLKIEATYQTILGGASLVRSEFIYTELVDGNPIALLRRGLCGCRSVFVRGSTPIIRRAFQGWAASQGTSYTWTPTRGLTDELCLDTLSILQAKLHSVGSPVLLEWMYTITKDFIFCDARDTDLSHFGAHLGRLKDDDDISVIDNLPGAAGHFQIDGFDLDLTDAPLDYAEFQAWNGAILSHFITRRRARPVRVTLLGPNR